MPDDIQVSGKAILGAAGGIIVVIVGGFYAVGQVVYQTGVMMEMHTRRIERNAEDIQYIDEKADGIRDAFLEQQNKNHAALTADIRRIEDFVIEGKLQEIERAWAAAAACESGNK